MQIFELLEWTEKTYPASKNEEQDGKSHWQFCVETLRRYIAIHAQMQRFYSKFIQNIYCPLIVYYKTKTSRKTVMTLRKILNNWCFLLQRGSIIQESCFTKESIQFFMEVIFYAGCRDFYLVLRLIPDLCMKAAECVHMVQRLLQSTESNGFERESSYIFEVWRPIESYQVQTKEEKKLKELADEKAEAMKDSHDQNIRLRLINESLAATRENLHSEIAKEEELNRKKTEAMLKRGDLSKQFTYYKAQVNEIKLSIGNSNLAHPRNNTGYSYMSDENRKKWISVFSSPNSFSAEQNPRTICNADARQRLKLDYQATNLEMEKINRDLAATRNYLKNLEDDLKRVLHEKRTLEKVEKLLEIEQKAIEAKLTNVNMNNRVITRYMSRITKNIKMAADRLPPVAP